MSSTYYQTTARPRGRRETGASETSIRSRAPSEPSNLTKKTSRTSDESSSARNTNSRPNSPATFMQRHRNLDRSSLLETMLTTSSSSTSLKSNKANAASEADSPLIIPSSNPTVSTPTSPLLTASRIEIREHRRSLHSKTSSKSMTDASKFEMGQYIVTPASITTSTSDAAERKRSIAVDAPEIPHEPSSRANLQPSVADASEDNTPTPSPSYEQLQAPFESAGTNRPTSQSSQTRSPRTHQDEVLPQLMQQPPQAWYSDPTSQTWHSTASPPQSPVIHQYGGFQVPGQAQYPYDFSYGYAPHMTTSHQAYASPYYPPPFSPPIEAGQPPVIERHISRSGSRDENIDLMTRIQSVLPDLRRLLEQYGEAQALPAPVENPVGGPPISQNEQLISLQQELDATKKEYERIIRKLVDENFTLKNEAKDRHRRSRSLEGDSRGSRKLKSEYEALQAQHQNLASSVDSIRLSKEELMAEKLGVEKHVELLKRDKHSIKDSHHRVLADLKAQHMEALAAKDSEHQKAIAEHKSLMSKVQLDLATLISKHTTTKRELESAHHSEASYRASAEARSKELEVARVHHMQQYDKLKDDHQRVLESLKQEHRSQRLRHEDETKKYLIELEAFRSKKIGWESESRALQAELQEHKAALTTERDAHDSLKAIHEERNKRTADLAEAMTSWRQKYAELQRENQNLDGVLHALGFGKSAAESEPEPQAPDPMAIFEEQINPVEEPAVASEKPRSITQEIAANPAKEEIAPVQEVKEEQPKVAEAVPHKELIKSKEPLRTESTIAEEAVTTPNLVTKPLPVEVRDSPKEATTTSRTEKGTTEASQPAEQPITFRPIHYYQVPGHYQ